LAPPPRSAEARSALLGYAAIVGAAGAWALVGVCTRELGALGVPATHVGAWRALLGGTCFAVHAALTSDRTRRDHAREHARQLRPDPRGARPRPVRPGGRRAARASTAAALARQWPAVAGFTLVGVVVFYTALPLAVDAGGLSLAYVLLYTAPIWVTIGAVLWLGERVGTAQVAAMVVAVVGVAAIALSAGGTMAVTAASVAWGLLAGISYSSYYLLGRRLFEAIRPPVLYAVVLPAGGVVLALAVRLGLPSAATWPWLALLAVGCTYLPYLLFSVGVRRVPSSRAVVVAMVEPVLATGIGVAFYGERPGAVGALGVAAVLVASTLVALGPAGSGAARGAA